MSTIAQLATMVCSEQPRILDLGCGYGDVTAEILKFRPHALAYMVDFSDEMMRIADERFKNYVNIKIFKQGEITRPKAHWLMLLIRSLGGPVDGEPIL